MKALGMALNAGAIVCASDDSHTGVLGSLRGKRFRLSYIFAPHYCIPLVLGRHLTLREIVKRTSKPKQSASWEPTLFALAEDEDE
jgi:hypothetical protein